MANLENNYDKEKDQSSGDELNFENAKEFVKDAIDNPSQTANDLADQAIKDVKSTKWWLRLLLLLFWVVVIVGTTVFIALNLDVTKKWAANQALQVLNKDFKARMKTESIDVNYFGNVTIKGISIEDYKGFEFFKAKEFTANSNWFKLAKNAINGSNSLSFNSIVLKQADIKVITYKGDSISNFIRYVGNFDSGKKRDPNKPVFQLKSRVQFMDSKVSIVNQNTEGDAGKWLTADHFNLVVPELEVKGGDFFAQINNLSFITKRWGKKHFVDTFSTQLSLTKEALVLEDATINTDHSLLQGKIKFSLRNGSWADFTNKVKWDLDLQNGSQISGYDISYFVTNWDNYKPVNTSGQMQGTLNDFRLENFVLGNRDVSIRSSATDFKDLLKGNFLIKTNQLSANFTYKDLKAMFPTFIASKLKKFADDFGRLRYNGSARVTPQEVFIAKGDLITGIGQAKINNFFLTDYSSALPKYKGYAEVTNLNTSVITKNKQVGLITGKFTIDGESFDVKTMRIKTQSDIAKIEILDKEINNVFLNGELNDQKCTGIIMVNDEQAKAKVDGLVDFSTSRIFADVKADVKYLNMSYFTGAKERQVIAGQVDGEIAMTSLNDLDLDANIDHFFFTNKEGQYEIPNASVKAFFDGDKRIVSVDAPGAVRGKIEGYFNLEDLAGMVQNGFEKVLVGPAPRKLYKGQSFTMDFNVEQDLVNYFLPELKLPKGANVIGSYNGTTNDLVMNIDADELRYITTKKRELTDEEKQLAENNPEYKVKESDLISRDSTTVNNLQIRINTANLNEQIFAQIERTELGQNVFKDISLTARNENGNLLRISTNFQQGTLQDEKEDNLKSYAININQTTNEFGDYVIRFDPTDLSFNQVVWEVDANQEHSITYRKKSKDFVIENLRFFSGDSEVLINNAEFKNANDFYADAKVKNLEIGKLLEMQDGGNLMGIQGLANGSIDVRKDANNLRPIVDLSIENIMMDNEEIGDLTLKGKDSEVPNVFDVEAVLSSSGLIGNNNLKVTGTVDNNPESPVLDINADMNDFDLSFANQFVKGIFSNMRGKANGVLNISGPISDIDYNGDIALSDFGLKLDFTGVDYRFDDTVIGLQKGLALLNDIGVKDARDNSKGTIAGAIRFETLNSMGVVLNLTADNLMVLDTQQDDFDLFWGRVYGSGDLYIDGLVNSLSISTPNMKVLRNSVFTFNSSSTGSVEEFKMLRFLQEGQSGELTLAEKKSSGANMNIDFNVEVDSGTQVNVLVGDGIGDIAVRGTSNDMRFTMSRSGNISMSGSYYVDNGTYNSKFILNRIFQIDKGSSIRWDGDAMNPALGITASYIRPVSKVGDYLNMGSLPPINIELKTIISNRLTDPKIDFDVVALDVASQVKEALATKMSQEDERLNQFASILIANTFISNSSGTGFKLDMSNFVEDSGINLGLKQLSAAMNTISNQLQIDLNYVKGDLASNTSTRATTSLNYIVSPRVKLKTGVGVPLNNAEAAAVLNNNVTGEGTIEYDASKKNDGSFLLRAYSKPMNIGMGDAGISSANQAYGGGVVFSRSAKTFKELFTRKKPKKKEKRKKSDLKAKKDSAINDSL